MELNLEQLCHQVRDLSVETGEFLAAHLNKISSEDIEKKGRHDLVTFVDKTSEKKLVEGLSKMLPEAGFLAEENSVTTRGEHYNWIVDPLDGTTNYVHGVPLFSISIALMKENSVILGVVYEVNLKECFYAWQGSPAFCNDKPISVTQQPSLDNSLLATGFPYTDFSRMDQYMDLLKYLMQNTQGVRRLGSAAVDLIYVACGRFDIFYEYGLKPWDVAAGAFIVQQAGGKVSDFKGGNDYVFGKEIIASNKLLYNNFIEILANYIH